MQRITYVSIGVGTAVIAVWLVLRRCKTKTLKLPDKWEEVGEVCSLNIYPVKSGRGQQVKRAKATRWGLAHGQMQDRCFLVVTASTGTFITGRQCGKLLGITVLYDDGVLTLQSDHNPTLKCDVKENLKHPRITETKIWGQPVRGVDCGDEAAKWLSDVLYNGEECVRLLYKSDVMKQRPPRRLDYYNFPQIKDSDSLFYADTSAFLITSQSSLDDLNTRLPQPIKMRNFRPNIVVSGARPYLEDDWIYVRIGDAVFRKIKPCERCLLTTIDPDTGERHPQQEPLKTLRSYRILKEPSDLAKTWATKPIFGCNMAMDIEGDVAVGDKVFAAYASANLTFSVFNRSQ